MKIIKCGCCCKEIPENKIIKKYTYEWHPDVGHDNITLYKCPYCNHEEKDYNFSDELNYYEL